jgi:hypothetical protein
MTTEQGLNDQKYLRRWSNKNFLAIKTKPISLWDMQDVPTRSTKVSVQMRNGKPVVLEENI